MSSDRLRLPPRLRTAFHAVFLILFLSGVGWWLATEFPAAEGETGSFRIAPWLLKIHGAAAMVALVVLGMLYPNHSARGWRLHRNRAWGGGLVAACVLLAATGYLLYYSGDESLREISSALHRWLGLGLPLIVLVHIWRGRLSRPQ